MIEHAAFVRVPCPGPTAPRRRLYQLERELSAALQHRAVGELDGVEVTPEQWVAFAYGPCADALVRAMLAVLERWRLPPGSHVAWRRGGLAEAEEQRDLSAPPPPSRGGVRGGELSACR